MSVVVNRGLVHLTIPDNVVKQQTLVSASTTKTLINIILTFVNERDSLKTLLANMHTNTKINQLNGIRNPATEASLKAASANTNVGSYVYAADINTMITHVNDLASTCGSKTSSYQTVKCSYPQEKVTIREIVKQQEVPDMQLVDPITGVGIEDAEGNPVMVPGLRNPVAVLDSEGNPTYYTITGNQIFTEGPVSNADITQVITLCTNPSITCPNRVKLTGWTRLNSADGSGVINACSNVYRSQIVYDNGSTTPNTVPSVAVDEMITADTFNLIIANLITINNALDSYKGWWDGPCNGACQVTCQISCQSSCQLSCQNCYGGTCHNQNCGGFS